MTKKPSRATAKVIKLQRSSFLYFEFTVVLKVIGYCIIDYLRSSFQASRLKSYLPTIMEQKTGEGCLVGVANSEGENGDLKILLLKTVDFLKKGVSLQRFKKKFFCKMVPQLSWIEQLTLSFSSKESYYLGAFAGKQNLRSGRHHIGETSLQIDIGRQLLDVRYQILEVAIPRKLQVFS